MQDIKEFTLEELKNFLKGLGQSLFHARQIFFWIYKRGVEDFSQMSDLSFDLRNRLKERFSLSGLKPIETLQSKDGTEKFIFQLRDRNFIEAVIIPAKGRVTGCVSTQAGCKFACRFCASGLLGFKRNLTTAEIIEEILYLKNHSRIKKLTPLEAGCQRQPSGVSDALPLTGLTHLVFMGTGEPLDNYENVMKAIRIIKSREALDIGARRITISTSGVTPGIKKLSEEGLQIELSVSLHAADDKIRSLLMPINKIYPIKDLLLSCRQYSEKTNRQVTFEYVLINGINSDLQNARKLSTILKGLRLCKVNLIPANPIKELKIEPPKRPDILLFKDYLLKKGLNVTLRKPRGEDIEAACGQLRLRYEKK